MVQFNACHDLRKCLRVMNCNQLGGDIFVYNQTCLVNNLECPVFSIQLSENILAIKLVIIG